MRAIFFLILIILMPVSLAWIDHPVTTNTLIRKPHMDEIRSQTNSVRNDVGLGSYAYTDSNIVAGSTPIRAVHFTQARSAIEGIYARIGEPRPSWSGSLTTNTQIRAVHMNELRSKIDTARTKISQKRCCGGGNCPVSDDPGCGTIDCDGKNYYYQTGSESPTSTETCYYRDYADITSNRCEGINNCKDANSNDCTSYSNSAQYFCGQCKYISSSSCSGTNRGSCSNYASGTLIQNIANGRRVCDGSGNVKIVCNTDYVLSGSSCVLRSCASSDWYAPQSCSTACGQSAATYYGTKKPGVNCQGTSGKATRSCSATPACCTYQTWYPVIRGGVGICTPPMNYFGAGETFFSVDLDCTMSTTGSVNCNYQSCTPVWSMHGMMEQCTPASKSWLCTNPGLNDPLSCDCTYSKGWTMHGILGSWYCSCQSTGNSDFFCGSTANNVCNQHCGHLGCSYSGQIRDMGDPGGPHVSFSGDNPTTRPAFGVFNWCRASPTGGNGGYTYYSEIPVKCHKPCP